MGAMFIIFSARRVCTLVLCIVLILIVHHLRAELSGCSHLLKELTEKVEGQDQELKDVRKEVSLLLSELGQTKDILSVISNELSVFTSQK